MHNMSSREKTSPLSRSSKFRAAQARWKIPTVCQSTAPKIKDKNPGKTNHETVVRESWRRNPTRPHQQRSSSRPYTVAIYGLFVKFTGHRWINSGLFGTSINPFMEGWRRSMGHMSILRSINGADGHFCRNLIPRLWSNINTSCSVFVQYLSKNWYKQIRVLSITLSCRF